jgi:hypothetical protein
VLNGRPGSDRHGEGTHMSHLGTYTVPTVNLETVYDGIPSDVTIFHGFYWMYAITH